MDRRRLLKLLGLTPLAFLVPRPKWADAVLGTRWEWYIAELREARDWTPDA